jgi:methionyl-tRNA formyltransferase
MLMDEGMDTGDMLLSSTTDILPNDNFESLHDKLAVIGADLLLKTVNGLFSGTVKPTKQPEENISYAPIINKEMGRIDFNKTATQIDCQIRAFTPWPSAFFALNGMRVKVISAFVGEKSECKAGTVIASKDNLIVACADNTSIVFTELQPEGKGKMTAKALLNGHPIAEGTVI